MILSAESIYALLVGGLIVMLTDSPYEWMIGELRDHRKLTICDIPTAVDDASDVYLPATIALILVPLIGGTVSSIRARRVQPALMMGAALLLLWIYRFFLRRLGC